MLVDRLVTGVVDGVERLHAVGPLGRVFAGDDRAGIVVDGVAEGLEMLVLDDACIGHVGCGIVDHCVALMVWLVECLGLETHCAVFELAEAVAVKLVDFSGEYNPVGDGFPAGAVGEEIGVQPYLHAVKQPVNQAVIASDGDALIGVVEIVVVKGHAHRQTADDECRKLGALASPLLLGVALDKLLVDVASYEGQCLLLKVAWLGYALGFHAPDRLAPLLVELSLRFGGSLYIPHLIERVHVEGQVVQPSVRSLCHRAVGVAVERHYRVDEIPHLLVRGMEDVRPVLVHVDSLDILAVDIASGVRPLVDDKTPLPPLRGKMRKRGAEQPGTHYQIVIFHIRKILRLN